MQWRLEKASVKDGVEIWLIGACWIYLIGPAPFASQQERFAFCETFAHLHDGRDGWWLMWHAGALDGCAHLQGDRGTRIGPVVLGDFLDAAGWYGGWWPHTWRHLKRWLDLVLGVQDQNPDLHFVFMQDHVDRPPLGWRSEDLEQFIAEREKLPNGPRTEVTILGLPGTGFWLHRNVQCMQLQNFLQDQANRGSAASGITAHSDGHIVIEISSATMIDDVAPGCQAGIGDNGQALLFLQPSERYAGGRLFSIPHIESARIEIRGHRVLVARPGPV